MITIPVRVCGDIWENPGNVFAQLNQVAGQNSIILDFYHEGPSLEEFGIINCLEKYCARYQVNPADIHIKNWTNRVEPVKYNLLDVYHRSHFFERCHSYWQEELQTSTGQYIFGFFVGRRTIPRMAMLLYLYENFDSQNLLSCMKVNDTVPWNNSSSKVTLDQLDKWVSSDLLQFFEDWCQNCSITSIDNHHVRDQYNPGHNTNLDLLEHYHRFDIELVAETYTRGNTFFPTEKTIRPLMAAKPMLIYGPRNFLQRLTQMGFETYASVWDESYDQLESYCRWQAMRKIIQNIMSMDTVDRICLVQNATAIADRNRLHLYNIIQHDSKDI